MMPENVRHLFPGPEPEPQQPEEMGPIVLQLLATLKDVPTACVSFCRTPASRHQPAGLVAFICGPSDAAEPDIEVVRCPTEDIGSWSEELVAPGPFRESHLKRLHTAGYKVLVKPLESVLQKMKVSRLMLSLPGLLTRLAFEGLIDEAGPDSFLLKRFDVAYLPSLALGSISASSPFRSNWADCWWLGTREKT